MVFSRGYGQYQAVRAFEPPAGSEGAGQLRLAVGDVVGVVETDESGWWAGHIVGQKSSGWFPRNILRRLPETPIEVPTHRPITKGCGKSSASAEVPCGKMGAVPRTPLRRRASENIQPVAQGIALQDGRRHVARSNSLEPFAETRRGPPAMPRRHDTRSPERTSGGRVVTPVSRAQPRASVVAHEARRLGSTSPAPPSSHRRTELEAAASARKTSPNFFSFAAIDGPGQASRDGRRVATPLGARASSPGQSRGPARQNNTALPPAAPRLRSTLPAALGPARAGSRDARCTADGIRPGRGARDTASCFAVEMPSAAADIGSVQSARESRQPHRPKRTSEDQHAASTTTATESSSDAESGVGTVRKEALLQHQHQLEQQLKQHQAALLQHQEQAKCIQQELNAHRERIIAACNPENQQSTSDTGEERKVVELQNLQKERALAAERRKQKASDLSRSSEENPFDVDVATTAASSQTASARELRPVQPLVLPVEVRRVEKVTAISRSSEEFLVDPARAANSQTVVQPEQRVQQNVHPQTPKPSWMIPPQAPHPSPRGVAYPRVALPSPRAPVATVVPPSPGPSVRRLIEAYEGWSQP